MNIPRQLNPLKQMSLDQEIDGSTDDFCILEMNNHTHGYIEMPKVTKISRKTNKKREFEDESTKKRFTNIGIKPSTAYVGANNRH